jgi:large subunit ribosomal protein L30
MHLLRGNAVAQLKITLIRSGIGNPRRHKAVLTGLGLTKLHKTVIREDRPEIRGMIRKVQHLVQVDEIDEGR